MIKKINIRKSLLAIVLVGIGTVCTNAQNVGINATGTAPAASAGLDISFTNKGVLVPRIALTAKNSASPVSSPATSLLVYNTATAGTSPNNVSPGYYYWNGSSWSRLKNGANRKILPSNVATSSTSLANVTGLSFPVISGVKYKFMFYIVYTANATSRGSRWTINGPAFTDLKYYSKYPSSGTANAYYNQATYDGAAATGNSASTTCNIAVIEGVIIPSSSSTEVIARFASEASGTMTAIGGISYVEWEILE